MKRDSANGKAKMFEKILAGVSIAISIVAFVWSYVTYENTSRHANERASFDVSVMELFEKHTSGMCTSGMSGLCRQYTKTLESMLDKAKDMMQSERTSLDPDDYKSIQFGIGLVETAIARLHAKRTIDEADNKGPNQ